VRDGQALRASPTPCFATLADQATAACTAAMATSASTGLEKIVRGTCGLHRILEGTNEIMRVGHRFGPEATRARAIPHRRSDDGPIAFLGVGPPWAARWAANPHRRPGATPCARAFDPVAALVGSRR